MSEPPQLRDYRAWHRHYDDPASSLSWRLDAVREQLREALDRHQGSTRVLSLCSGDGRDILGVLADRSDAERVEVTLLEIDPEIAGQARDAAAASGLSGVDVRCVDAGTTDACAGAAPADIVLLVGIFGNISDQDIERTVTAAPRLCRPGATVLWSRGLQDEETNDSVRGWFTVAGFTELAYAERQSRSDRTRAAIGSGRYDGPEQPLIPGQRLFTFVR